MMQIPCPCCGLRDEEEFCCGGQAHLVRPAEPDQCSDADWAAYLYQRHNTKGLHLERWRHTFGCRQWFNLARDTVSHEIVAVYPMGETPPVSLQGQGTQESAQESAKDIAKESARETIQ